MAYQIRLTSNNPTNVIYTGGTNYMTFRVWDTVTRRYIKLDENINNYSIWNHSPNIYTESTLGYNSDKTEGIITYTVYRNYNLYPITGSTVGITFILDNIQFETYIEVNQDASIEDTPIKLLVDSVTIKHEEHFSLSTKGVGDNYLPLLIADGINPENIVATYDNNLLGSEMIDVINKDSNELTIYFNDVNYNIDTTVDVTFSYGDYSETLTIICPKVVSAINFTLQNQVKELPNYNTTSYTTSVSGFLYNPNPTLFRLSGINVSSNSTKIKQPSVTYNLTGNELLINFTWRPNELEYDTPDIEIYRTSEMYIVLLFDNYSTTIVQPITFAQYPHAYIHFVDNTLILDGSSKVNYVIPFIGDNNYKTSLLSLPEWATGYISTNKLVLTYIEANNSNLERDYTIQATFVYDNPDETETTEIISIRLIQGATGNILAVPLWSNLFIKNDSQTEYYKVKFNSHNIFGRSLTIRLDNYQVQSDVGYGVNDEDIYINLKNYLQSYFVKNDLDFNKNMISDTPLEVTVLDQYNNTIIDTTPVYYNYTYDEDFYKNNEFLTGYYQIQDFFSGSQYFISTVQDFIYEDIQPGITVYDYNNSIIQQDTYNILEDNTQTTFIQPIQWNAERIVIYDNNFRERHKEYKKTCNDYSYCLYYLNPAGGWNWFLFTGEPISEDSIDRKTVLNKYNKIYYEDISTTYKLSSGILNDKQSSLFKYLIQSPRCYLHDLNKNKINEVIISDNKVSTQTFKSNGRKFSSYSIKVKEATNKYITLY